MIDNEMELLRMIRDHDEPEKALSISVQVITLFLMQHESSVEQAVACPLEPCEIVQ